MRKLTFFILIFFSCHPPKNNTSNVVTETKGTILKKDELPIIVYVKSNYATDLIIQIMENKIKREGYTIINEEELKGLTTEAMLDAYKAAARVDKVKVPDASKMNEHFKDSEPYARAIHLYCFLSQLHDGYIYFDSLNYSQKVLPGGKLIKHKYEVSELTNKSLTNVLDSFAINLFKTSFLEK